MAKKILKVMLTEKDIKTISQNETICTDSHGKHCTDLISSGRLKDLN